MDCKQVREVLDCYVDDELSLAAASAAEAHLAECPACARVAGRLLSLRRHVRRAVAAHEPPAALTSAVRRALRPSWSFAGLVGTASMRPSLAAAALLVLMAGGIAVAGPASIRGRVADVLDAAVLAIASDATAPVDLEGTLVCRDCELERTHGEGALCKRIGHHGALATSDGRIWNIVEQPASRDLVHNTAWLGRTVRVRARLYRHAGTAAVEHFTIVG